MNLNTRALNFIGAFLCYQLIVTALYFQYAKFMEPCPLCIFSRVAVVGLGSSLLLSGIFNPKHSSIWNKLLQIWGIFWAGMGIWISAKHVYVQSRPQEEVLDCGAPLDMLMDAMPVTEVVSTVLTGEGKCAEINFQFLGLTMPGWMLVIFAIALLVMTYRLFMAFKAPKVV